MLSYSDHNAKCCSNHLTSFAILLDVAPDVPISEKDDRILTTISYIGSGLSIFGLFLTILTYTLFPCLRRDKSGQILINLCSSMLMMNIFYVIGSQRSHVNNIARSCMAIGVLLHYSVISTLGWMSVEAFNLYRMLITVFSTHEKMFIMKRMLYAWGIPLLLVIIALGVDPWNYYDPKSDGCHLSSASPGVYYGTYITPACIILLFNVAVFFMVCRVVLKPRFDHLSGKSSVSTSQIRGVLTVSALLGISWLLGIFAIGKAKVVFQYAFTITNSLQGFCIFVFRCLSHSEAKAAWWQLLVHGTLKRRRGPGYKSTSETSSTLHRQNTKIQRQDSWKRKTTSVKLVSGVNESSYVPKELESRMSKTLESLPKNTSDSETVYCIAKDEKSNLRGSKRGQFWLDKYRLIVGLEKTINNDHTNSYQNKATDA